MHALFFVLCTVAIAQDFPILPGPVRTPFDLNNYILRELHLPDAPSAAEDHQPISVARLKHKVSKKAQQAYDLATALAQKDKHTEAALELELAVAIDPAFADAYNNLAVQHFLLQHAVKADASIRRALDLDPAFVTAHINSAHFSLRKGDLALAEKAARRAVALGDEKGEAQKILTVIRAAQQR